MEVAKTLLLKSAQRRCLELLSILIRHLAYCSRSGQAALAFGRPQHDRQRANLLRDMAAALPLRREAYVVIPTPDPRGRKICSRKTRQVRARLNLLSWLEVMSRRCSLLLGVLILTPVLSSAQTIKLAPELGQIPGNQTVSDIVQYKPPMLLALLSLVTNTSSSAAIISAVTQHPVGAAEFVSGTPVSGGSTVWGSSAMWGNDVVINGEN